MFILRVVRDWLDDLADRDDVALTAPSPVPAEHMEPIRVRPAPEIAQQELVGIATNGGGDALIFRMLNFLLKPSGVRLTILSATGSPLRVSDKVEQLECGLIVMSHLPPLGLTRTRYLIKRLRARTLIFRWWSVSGMRRLTRSKWPSNSARRLHITSL